MNKNSAKGRTSFDAEIGDTLVHFFNRNITPYPTEVGGPNFDLVPVTQKKDIMLNVGRIHAQQEYDRIIELVKVLEKQATGIKRRLEVTEAVYAAKYDFQPVHNKIYWLVFDSKIKNTRLSMLGPKDWSTGSPEHYQYLYRVKWLGDHTWTEIDEQGNYVN